MRRCFAGWEWNIEGFGAADGGTPLIFLLAGQEELTGGE